MMTEWICVLVLVATGASALWGIVSAVRCLDGDEPSERRGKGWWQQ